MNELKQQLNEARSGQDSQHVSSSALQSGPSNHVQLAETFLQAVRCDIYLDASCHAPQDA